MIKIKGSDGNTYYCQFAQAGFSFATVHIYTRRTGILKYLKKYKYLYECIDHYKTLVEARSLHKPKIVEWFTECVAAYIAYNHSWER